MFQFAFTLICFIGSSSDSQTLIIIIYARFFVPVKISQLVHEVYRSV